MRRLSSEIVIKISRIVIYFSVLSFISCEKNSSQPLFIDGDGVYDVEGNYYNTVVIGDQEWMSENLNSSIFCSGDSIPYTGSSVQVKTYDNNPDNALVFGKLYNYQAVLDTLGLCPCGWHIPSELEFARLINYLGGYVDAMRKMKSQGELSDGTGLWNEAEPAPLFRGNNSSGFNALPGGEAFTDTFLYKNSIATFWSIPQTGSDALMYELGNFVTYVSRQVYELPSSKENYYHSVRCIRDFP